MHFEWDALKNLSNQAKHDIDFETAQRVFADPLHLTVPDQVIDLEMRWRTIGLVGGQLLVVVVHTDREDERGEPVLRIISARKATKHERRDYENG